MVMCAPTSTPSPTSTPLSHVDPLSHTIFANLFGFLFVSFAMYDNIRIYRTSRWRREWAHSSTSSEWAVWVAGAGATESGNMCAKCVRALLQVQIVRRRNSGLFN